MKRYVIGFALMAAGLMLAPSDLGLVASASAQDFNSRDRLLLFYNYYNGQQNSRRILNMQQNVARGIQSQQSAIQRLEQNDPIEQYVRQGQAGAAGRRPLPSIYGGSGGSRQYFMRITYFNPPRR